MFDKEAIAVVVVLVGVTLAMGYYAKFILPKKIEERTRESMKAFSTAVELRFPIREGLSARVVGLGRELGKRLGFAQEELRKLEMAGRLRDIGLCAVPYRLINDKPTLEWSDADNEVYDRHPEVGAAMLELVPSLGHLAGIVRSHQVCFDGSTGPFFPSRESLPKEARALKVVCDYVWFERTQGSLLARESLRQGAGSTYDPEVVEVMLGMITSSSVRDPAQPVTV